MQVQRSRSLSIKNLYIASLAASLIGVFFLLTENFGAWQDRNSFFGVVDGYVWIGSEKAFPWAQIGILTLSFCLLYIGYTSYKGYNKPETVTPEQIRLGFLSSKIEVALTLLFAALFSFMVWDSDWWWFDTGFYSALISGGINFWIYRQL
jgi:hypothetical protein